MRTKLPESISSKEEARDFISELVKNNEIFHPEDDAHDIMWETTDPTHEEKDKLNYLMEQIWQLKDFDPFDYIGIK